MEEGEVKSTALESFLFGLTLGIGITLFALYAQKPSYVATSLETITGKGRTRRIEQEERRLNRERLKAMGFTTAEVDEIFP